MNIDIILEWTAVTLNVVYVWLAARKDIRCWYFGGIASILSVILFIRSGLYSESYLYSIYALMAVWGYLSWRKNESVGPIKSYGFPAHLGLVIIALSLAIISFATLGQLPEAKQPVVDGLTTGFSLVATWLTIRKELHSWAYWLIINGVSTWLYHTRELPLYATFMAVMGIMAIFGFIRWRKEYFRQIYA